MVEYTLEERAYASQMMDYLVQGIEKEIFESNVVKDALATHITKQIEKDDGLLYGKYAKIQSEIDTIQTGIELSTIKLEAFTAAKEKHELSEDDIEILKAKYKQDDFDCGDCDAETDDDCDCECAT